MTVAQRARQRLAQFACGRRGHMEVTRNGNGRVERVCFICDKRLGRGWNFRGLRAPKVIEATRDRLQTTIHNPRAVRAAAEQWRKRWSA